MPGGIYLRRIGWTILALAVLFALAGAISEVTSAALTGSQLITLERSDMGEMYAAVTFVLDLAVTQSVAAVLIHDQVVTWGIGRDQRYAQWDVSGAWRPIDGWSISVGRRWRVGPPPDYGGPWTYVQVWRGM